MIVQHRILKKGLQVGESINQLITRKMRSSDQEWIFTRKCFSSSEFFSFVARLTTNKLLRPYQ